MDTTPHKLNFLHDNLKFTSECEKDGNFHFLDVSIKSKDSQFYTSTYVKPSNAGLFLLWSSFTNNTYKMGLFYCFAHLGFVIAGCYSITRLLG